MNRKIYLYSLIWIFIFACNLTEKAIIETSENAVSTVSHTEPTVLTEKSNDSPLLTVWQEPQSGAFEANVPSDWIINGGLSSSYGFLHPWVEMAAPDGSAAIQVGYRQFALNILPHPTLDQAGFPEGVAIQLDDGSQVPVTSFQTGEEVAEAEARTRLQPICSELVISDRHNVSSFSNSVVETSEGVVTIKCTAQGNQLVGQYHATTRKISDEENGSGVWFSDNIAGYIALIGHENQAVNVYEALLDSFTYNPQWQVGQQEVVEIPGLYHDLSAQDSGSESPFFEDQYFDWCIGHGFSC